MPMLNPQRLCLLVPPPVVMLVLGLLMWAVSDLPIAFLQAGSFARVFPAEVAWGFYLLGAALMTGAIAAFVLAKTTVNPMKPGSASTLLTKGVFACSRNPIYLADLLLLTGWCIALGNVFNLLWLVGFVVYITRFQIIPEELVLVELFGAEYIDYCTRVRRWI